MKKGNGILTYFNLEFNQFSPFKQLLFFCLIILVSAIFVMSIGMLSIMPFFGSEFISDSKFLVNCKEVKCLMLSRCLQIISQIGVFIVPVIVYIFFTNTRFSVYLGIRYRNGIIPLFIGLLLVVISYPLMEWLLELNQQIRLPSVLAFLENKMIEAEKIRNEMSNTFMSDNSENALLANIFMFGIFPAIGEELVFRGVLIRIFIKWTGSIHKAIMISSFLFCIVHFQFYSFLPRLFMGMVLGYLLYFTGSILIPILVHLFNNMIILLLTYFDLDIMINTKVNEFLENGYIAVVLSGILIIVSFFILSNYNKYRYSSFDK